MDLKSLGTTNLEALRANPYPGRGIVVGMDDTGGSIVIAYWIMGRSANSRNRVFASDPKDGRVWTEAADPSKVTDPSLIIYNAMRELPGHYVVSNGDQTDTIAQALAAGKHFRQALGGREYEPDAPNFTPRISGIVSLREGPPVVELSIQKKSLFGPGCDHQFFRLGQLAPGFGHCITTYRGDGDPLPSFEGEPRILPLHGKIEALAHTLWAALNPENRVSLAVKFINKTDGASHIFLVNRFGQ